MSFENSIKSAQEIKNQSCQATHTSASTTRQSINLGKGIPANYELNKLGRPTNEGCEVDTTTGEIFND